MEACWCMGWAGLGGAACGCRQDREGVPGRSSKRERLDAGSRRELLDERYWRRQEASLTQPSHSKVQAQAQL